MRLVSLCPSLTDTLFALGRGDWLVGRSKFCISPSPLVDTVPKVGGTKNPRLPQILSLAPDLVFLNEEENRREDADALAAAGLTIHSSFPHDLDDVDHLLADLGELLNATPAAATLRAELATARAAAYAAQHGRRRVRFAYLIWRDPVMTVTNDTYISSLLTEAGGLNVFAENTPRYPSTTLHNLVAAAPEVILLPSEPFPFAAKHADDLAAATGLPRHRFLLCDGAALSWHGARSIAGLAYATALFTQPHAEPSP